MYIQMDQRRGVHEPNYCKHLQEIVKLRSCGLADKLEGQKASDKFYWDAKWSSVDGQKTLFAASAAGTLDIYRAV